MNYHGLLVGLGGFLIIGLLHPLVIKGEYFFGVKIWIAFLLLGIAALTGSLVCPETVVSAWLGLLAFSAFWSIGEVSKQRERVRKGWFPANPKRRG